MHTDPTLKVFDDATASIGQQFRAFTNKTCPAFDTQELQREFDARKRRKTKGTDAGVSVKMTRRRKTLNLQTYKYHSLGDYPAMIRRFGTCDSYSTELVSYPSFQAPRCKAQMGWGPQGELEHRTPKARYSRTNRKEFVKQMAQLERRQARIRRIRAKNFATVNIDAEALPSTPDVHHHIGKSQNNSEHIGLFVQKHLGDPAVKVFVFFY